MRNFSKEAPENAVGSYLIHISDNLGSQLPVNWKEDEDILDTLIAISGKQQCDMKGKKQENLNK